MQRRSDLAVELLPSAAPAGCHVREWDTAGIHLHRLTVGRRAAPAAGCPAGVYITASLPPLTDNDTAAESVARTLGRELRRLLPPDGTVLVAGLGNNAITPDALGPRAVSHILATRHIPQELARSVGLEHLRPCAVLATGVLGNTGLESEETVVGLCRTVNPAAVIAIDALAARSASRLGCTVQLTDTGIAPGSGVGNHRRALCSQTLGMPVVGIGVPTVVDVGTLTGTTGGAMMVTPREIDLLIARAARLIAMTVHAALHPAYSPLELLAIAQ